MAKWSWPFGRSGHDTKSAPPLVALTQMGAAQWGGRDAAALMRDGYKRNAVAYRCVRMIAEAAASVALTSPHEGVRALLKCPAPECAGATFLETVYTQLQLSGNVFVEAVRLEDSGPVDALFALPMGAVRPVLDVRGWVEAWAVKARHGERTLRRDSEGWSPLLHVKLYDPAGNVMGQPPLAAARRALDLHNASADWAKALIDNSAKPSGALIYGGGGRMSDDQFDRLKTELEAQFSGAANAGRPLLLEGDLDWRQMSLSPADMDFQEARNAAAREIALAMGVPPMLLGIPGDNTYANYAQANLAFWRMTVLPLAEKLAGALSQWLETPFGEPVDVGCDVERVSALAAERDALWARLEGANFASVDEKRALAGLSS